MSKLKELDKLKELAIGHYKKFSKGIPKFWDDIPEGTRNSLSRGDLNEDQVKSLLQPKVISYEKFARQPTITTEGKTSIPKPGQTLGDLMLGNKGSSALLGGATGAAAFGTADDSQAAQAEPPKVPVQAGDGPTPTQSSLVKDLMKKEATTEEKKNVLKVAVSSPIPVPITKPTKDSPSAPPKAAAPSWEDKTYDDLMAQRERLLKAYEEKGNRTAWYEAAEAMANALTSYAAAKEGLRTGVDLSQIKGSNADWDKQLNRAKDLTDKRLETVEMSLNKLRADRSSKEKLDKEEEDRKFQKQMHDERLRSNEKIAGMNRERRGSSSISWQEKQDIIDAKKKALMDEKERKLQLEILNKAENILNSGLGEADTKKGLLELNLPSSLTKQIIDEVDKGGEGWLWDRTSPQDRLVPSLNSYKKSLTPNFPKTLKKQTEQGIASTVVANQAELDEALAEDWLP